MNVQVRHSKWVFLQERGIFSVQMQSIYDYIELQSLLDFQDKTLKPYHVENQTFIYLFIYLFIQLLTARTLYKLQFHYTQSKNIQIILKSEAKDWSPKVIYNSAPFSYDISDIKPHSYLSAHQTIHHSFLNSKLYESTSFRTLNCFFHALNSCRDFTRAWGEPAQSWCSAKMWPFQAFRK